MQNHLLHSVIDVFRIRREERLVAGALLLLLLVLNAMVVAVYFYDFTPITADAWHQFVGRFQISGFDPITYVVVTDWQASYNVYRHPLLAFYMFVPYLLNQVLMMATGHNCALFIVAAIQVFCGFYTFVFMRRMLIEIVGLQDKDATLLTFYFFSLAYVMLTCMVPDHFVISMLILVLSLYVAGRRMKSGRPFKIWQTVVYFLITGGTSLNNGLKIFLAALFVNGRRFFRVKFLALAVVLPSAFIWVSARLIYHHFALPLEQAKHAALAKKKAAKAHRDSIARFEAMRRDSIARAQGDTAAVKQTAQAAKPKARRKQLTGKAMGKGEFSRWTDVSTSRWASLVENGFGESLQLHQDYTLLDLYGKRPMIVGYRWTWNYVVEGAVVLLMLGGIWAGRRERWLWLCLSYFGLDALLHFGLGFAINEVYLMTAHWAYVVPVATAFLLIPRGGRRSRSLPLTRTAVSLLTLWLWTYNVALIVRYLFV